MEIKCSQHSGNSGPAQTGESSQSAEVNAIQLALDIAD